jgi:FMN phosphatase YigB (HAD superfamily)
MNCIIAFDIHGVLFKLDYRAMLRILWRSSCKWLLLKAAFNPWMWRTVFRLLREYSSVETFFVSLAHAHPTLKPCIPLFIELAAAQTPIAGTIAIAQELKAQGYPLHIISNIGQQMLARFIAKFPDIFALFDAIHVTCIGAHCTAKPHARMYQEYTDLYNPTHKRVIFIDDRQDNIEGAARFGFAPIHFHSAQQLRTDLIACGVMLKPAQDDY